MSEWIRSTLDQLGYGGVVLLMTLENLFPPIPSEVVMPMAGYTAGRGELVLAGVILAGTFGSLLGALPLYWLGAYVGAERLEQLARRHGAWLTVSPREVRRAVRWFERHGARAVFLCRLVPGLRSLISIPAGVARMPLARFLAWTALGSALWAGALAWCGQLLGERHDVVQRWIDPILWVVLAAAVVLYLVRLVRLRRGHGG